MMAWLSANGPTIIVGLVVLLIVGLVIRNMYKDKKAGKTSCSCGDGCGGCASEGMCHPKAPD